MDITGFKLSPLHDVLLRSERLVMRRFTREDPGLIVELDSDPEVVRWVGNPEPTTLAVVDNRIFPRFFAWYDKGPNHGYWAAHEIATGDFIGWFHYRPAKNPPHEVELGYRLRRAAWGKGYATEGSRALLTRGFDELHDPRVVAEAFRPHLASIHVMKKLGMVFDREEMEDGVPVDWYAIDAPTWVARERERERERSQNS